MSGSTSPRGGTGPTADAQAATARAAAARAAAVRAATGPSRDQPDRDGRDDDVPSAWIVAVGPLPVVIAALAIRPLVQGISWWVSGVVVAAFLVGMLLLVRRSSRAIRFVTLVASLVAASCAAALLNGIQPLGWLDHQGALGQTLMAIRLNPAPLPQTDAIRLVVTVAIAWVAGVSLFLAAISRTAALAAAPALVILVVPGVVTGTPASTPVVVSTAVAFLALLWLSVRPIQHALPAAVVAAIAVVVAVALPMIVPLNSSWLSGVTGAIQAPIQPGQPGTLLRLGDDLRRPAQLEVFRYRTASGDPEYLKLANLDDFGTGDWVPTVTDASTAPTADQSQYAVGVNPRLAQRGDVTIRITGLSSQYLPLPSGAVSIESRSTTLDLAQWRWMGDSNTVRSTGPATRRGATYEAYGASTFAGPYLDAVAASGRLSAFDGRGWSTPSTSELETDLQVPKNLPASISRTAARVAGDAGSAYDQARALEEYFRSDLFTYSETAPVEQGYDGDSMDVIAKFLQVREGYCVHFSSAMAVMARTLGIPSRIAIGYRPTGTGENGEYTVTNRQLHAWPELYIRGAGWVAFEPTPADSSGSTSTQADPTATPSAQASETPLPAPGQDQATATPTPSASAGAQGGTTGGGSGAGGGSVPWGGLLAVLVALAALASPGAVRAVRRRRRLAAISSGRDPGLQAWRELVDDVTDHGYAPGAAPPDDAAAVARTARAVLGRLRPVVPPAVVPALERAVDAVDAERFAPPGAASVDRRALLDGVLAARSALDAAVPSWRRVVARLAPRSLAPGAPTPRPRRPSRA